MKFKDKICKDKTFKLIMWLLFAIVIIVGLYASQKIIYSVTADEKGPFVIYLDVQNAKEFAENGVGIYAYNSASEKDSSVPAEMKPSEMGKGIYEYTLDRKWKYVAFTGGFGSWNYELATLPVNIEWEHNTPCFVLAKPDGTNTRGVWRNLSSTLYFDASLIKNKKVFVENGVYVCAYEEIENSDGLVVVQKPVRMQQSEKGEDIYEYTFDRPYSIVRFMLGDTTDAEPASDLVNIDWSGYASPCYRMTLPDSYEDVEPEETSTEETSVEESETEESESEESSVEESETEESESEESSVEESETEKSESEESSAWESETEKNSVEESSNEESSVEGSTAEESSEQESSAQESAVEESSAQESTTETSETTTVEEISSAEAESSAVEQTVIEHPETAEGAMSEEYSEEMQSARSINKWVKIALAGQEARTVFRVTENQTPVEQLLANASESESSSAPESSSQQESERVPESSSQQEPERAIVNESQDESERTSEHSSEKETENTSEHSSEKASESTSEASSESEPESASEDGSESEQETSSSGEGEGGEPDGELYDIDADTLMYAEVAALAIPRSVDTVQTIYFDSESNASQSWDTDAQIYVYLFNSSTKAHSDFIAMSESSRTRINPTNAGKLWEYSLSDDERANYDSAIFLTNSGFINGNNSIQTTNITLSGSYPCYKINGTVTTAGTDKDKKTWELMCDMGSPTRQGENMYFYDVTGKLGSDVTGVNAYFNGTGLTENIIQVQEESDSGRYYVVIPGDISTVPYDKVQFKNALGTNLSEQWSFIDYTGTADYGFAFEANSKNTYYYAATEKKTGTNQYTTISGWGKQPGTEPTIQSETKLYFDKLYFPVNKGGKLQIGDNAPVTLTVDSENNRILSYKFTADTPTTTVLTFIDAEGTKYHFRWTDFGTAQNKLNLVTLDNSIASVSKTYSKGITVYFDATYSKLPYYSEDIGQGNDYSIPGAFNDRKGVIRYYATGTGKPDKEDNMELADSYTKDGHTWSDVYKVDLPDGYDKIVFSNFDMANATNYGGHAESTITLDIPATLSNPCFYADAGDDAIYTLNSEKRRDGYWDEVYKIRNAEAGKTGRDVVDISNTETFTRDPQVLYVDTTFYDYYTDYELNGNNRDDYTRNIKGGSQRNWVTFRQFDQALSDYYKQNSVDIPIYTGHFQPTATGWDYPFGAIAPTLELYGHSNTNAFYSTNNSSFTINGGPAADGSDIYKSAAQGLVKDQLDNGVLMLTKGGKSGSVPEPHFDEDFLLGNNSKNAVLGDVYHNVAFPFKQKDVNNNGVKYWYFDSKETTLAMQQDQDNGTYYLKDVSTTGREWSKNVDSKSAAKAEYGFFPFNKTSTLYDANTYNYGFGAKLEFEFRLTESGTVKDKDGKDVNITFDFAGDDDVWVFIDGKLVLDVGGAHGVSDGTINFATKTATVTHVKASAGSTGSTSKPFTMTGKNTDIHTLTMFYMERGMWESNMHISFNFPDENKLEVQKKVDMENVNPIFQDLFSNKDLFTYRIQTLATHYGETPVVPSEGEKVDPVTYTDFRTLTLTPAAGNVFENVTSFAGQDNVAHWYAKLDDKTGSYRNKRYGTIELTAEQSIEKMRYLEFKFYYDYNDTPSLNNMYLQLVDSKGKIMGNTKDYLSGKTSGVLNMAGKKWVTVKIDLSTLTKQEGFNNLLKQIKFGYNYPRHIYLDDFTFKPSTMAGQMTGFTVKQVDIPDYGSASGGELKIPEGAVYSSTTGINNVIDADGTFVLQNNETVTFLNQFRQGSYIYLAEESNPLFETSYTMYENGQAVTAFGTGSTTNPSVTNPSPPPSMVNVSACAVDDGRKENNFQYSDEVAGSNFYQAHFAEISRPENTFIFRSYANPDTAVSATKLRVVYTNRIKTGSLKLRKESLYSGETLNGTYAMEVTFTNIGGIALENEPIKVTVQLDADQECIIPGIPLGTFYTIEEITPTDGSYLGKVEVSDTNCMKIHEDTGTIEADIRNEGVQYTATFKNTKEEKISVTVIKHWQDEVSGSALSQNIPDSVLVRLQRKKSGEDDTKYTSVTGYEVIEFTPKFDALGNIVWQYTINGLDKVVDYEHNDNTEWIYRFVEIEAVTDAGGNVTGYNVLENGNVITLTDTSSNSGDFKVTYTPTGDEITEATRDYTITNTLLGPVNLKITKKSMQSEETIPGVQFVLTKWNGTAYDTITDGNKTTSDHTGDDKTTGGIATFENLENGRYKLTEMKTASGYTLLKESMIIIIDRKDGIYKYCMESEYDPDTTKIEDLKDLTFINDTRTISLEIKNAQNIVLPATGWNGLWKGIAIISAMVLMFAIMLIREERKRRRRRLRQRRRREGRPPKR